MGALYNHPLEALLLDTLGAGVSMYTVGLSCRLAAAFFTASTVKTVLDHSGYCWPLNPVHGLFPNGAAFHDVHHDIRHIKVSVPYAAAWFVLHTVAPTQDPVRNRRGKVAQFREHALGSVV
jgi:sphinganine C4-monooxygenase